MAEVQQRERTLQLVLAAAMLAAAAPAAAETFPSAMDPLTVEDWLQREAGARPDQVVAISPSAATRILSIAETAPGVRRALVDAQSLNPHAAARTGALAWRMLLDVDCGTGRVKLGPTTGYASRRAAGPGVVIRAADPGWREAPRGTQLAFLRDAACRMPIPPPPAPQAAKTGPKPPVAKAVHPAPPVAGVAVQVISSPDRRDVDAALRRYEGRRDLVPVVAPAEVRGAATYRGLLTGFASREAAASFCAELQHAGRACFLRQAPAAGRPLKPVATR